MNELMIPLALLSGLALTATAISLFALHRAHLLLREVDRRRAAPAAMTSEADQDLREALEALSAQVQDLTKQPAIALEPGVPRPALNLTRRSQALRMHRRGDTPEKIASALEMPRQEVELLVKVHGIILSSV